MGPGTGLYKLILEEEEKNKKKFTVFIYYTKSENSIIWLIDGLF